MKLLATTVMLLYSVTAFAQLNSSSNSISVLDTTGNQIKPGDNGNNAVRVNVVAGSSGNAAASATGSAVPASADYNGINVAGTLRGQTGVNVTGVIYAAQSDITSVNGTATGNLGAAVTNAGLAAGFEYIASLPTNTTGNMAMGQVDINGRLLVSRPASGCGQALYDPGFQFVPLASTSLTATATCVDTIGFWNTDTVTHAVTLQDQSTACNTGVCIPLNAFIIPPLSNLIISFNGMKFVGGIKWNTDLANKVIGNLVATQ